MIKELGLKEKRIKRREREVEEGNIFKKGTQLLQSWGQLCPGRGRCD